MLVDNLSYTYTGNKLTALQESARTSLPEDIYQPGAVPNGTYEYDANGNMKKDSRKSLTFNYNALNLLSVVKEKKLKFLFIVLIKMDMQVIEFL